MNKKIIYSVSVLLFLFVLSHKSISQDTLKLNGLYLTSDTLSHFAIHSEKTTCYFHLFRVNSGNYCGDYIVIQSDRNFRFEFGVSYDLIITKHIHTSKHDRLYNEIKNVPSTQKKFFKSLMDTILS
jgi:hypothetical protein